MSSDPHMAAVEGSGLAVAPPGGPGPGGRTGGPIPVPSLFVEEGPSHPVDRGPIPVPSLFAGDLDRPSVPVPAAAPPPRSGRWVLEWVAVAVVALVLAIGVRTFVAQMFFIPSGSMLPTLQVGDRIVVDKVGYHLGGVARGDIVVFKRPPLEHADYTDLVKRVIGLPGDTVSAVDGRVYINGRPLAEPWLPRPLPVTLPSPVPEPFNLSRPYTVPAGHYFVMGDNRTDSEDSRYFGPIPASLIVGTMAFKVWPLDTAGWLVVAGLVALVVVAMVLVAWWAPASRRPDRGTPGRGPPVGVGTA